MSSFKTHGPNTRYDVIDSTFFVGNRARLAAKLRRNSLVILHSNDIIPVNGDDHMPFKQNSNLFYLSGIDQEETVLVMYHDAEQQKHCAILFVKETSREIAIWEGAKYTYDEVRERSGVAEVRSLQQFYPTLQELMGAFDHVYLDANEGKDPFVQVETRNMRFARWCKKKYPAHHYEPLSPLMTQLRMIKSEKEIDLIRQAGQITETAFKEVFPKISPGMYEYEIEALFIESFTRQRSDGFAYSPIIASGKNTCVLHYTANNGRSEAGDLLLLDIGASYAHYKADITRVVPVSGRFTKRQKSVYRAVMTLMEEAKKILIPSHNLSTYHQQLRPIIEETLLSLGLITQADIKAETAQAPAYRKYCMHGISHHLGLQTHDLTDKHVSFAPGMVLTIEPCIYIPEERIGIRLENNVVIRANGIADLTASLPLAPEEIENSMNSF